MLYCAVKIVIGNFPMLYYCKETRNFFGAYFLFVFGPLLVPSRHIRSIKLGTLNFRFPKCKKLL